MVVKRRWLIGAGLAGTAAAVGTALYRISPTFWRQFVREWNRPIAAPRRRPSPADWPDHGLHAAWLGHSTVLLKMDGFTILTDPVFSSRAGFHLGPLSIGVKRLVEPALDPKKLPRVDLILLSHAHMDHFDLPSLRALENSGTRVITAHKTDDLLNVERYKSVRTLRWGEHEQSGPALVRAIEVNHWGARVRSDTWRGYNGYTIESGRYRVLFAGDTAQTDAFRQLKSQRGFDLAIMPIGAYNPWIRYHCNPEQAWEMVNHASAEFIMPVHHQTFSLGREPVREPIQRFSACARQRPDRLVTTEIGQEFRLS